LIRHYSMEGARFRAELGSWNLFRDYQQDVRRDLRIFFKIQKHIDTYWQRNCINGDLKPQLNIKSQMQTKVDEWKEFFFCQHQMRGPKALDILKARKQARSLLDELEATALGGSLTAFTDAMYSGKRWVDMAMNDLEKWDQWLEWITRQLPIITLEYTSSVTMRGEGAQEVSSHQSGLASNVRTQSFTSSRIVPSRNRRQERQYEQ